MKLVTYIILLFSTHGLSWCDYDPKYPAVQIETAIRFHFFSVASMYKVSSKIFLSHYFFSVGLDLLLKQNYLLSILIGMNG